MTTPSRSTGISDRINAMDVGSEQVGKSEAVTIEHNTDNNKRHWPFDEAQNHSENSSLSNPVDHVNNGTVFTGIDKWSGGRSRSRSGSGPEQHIRFNEVDLQRVDHPPSQPFLEHRLSFNTSERHPVPTTADGHFTAEHHIQFNPADLQRVDHPPSQPFLEHRRTHYHAEAPVTPEGHFVEPHIHFKEADVRRVEHPPSPRFLEHRHSLDHAEVHPGFNAEPHIHFKEADVKRVDHPPSPRFIEHRRSYDHSELHPLATTADGHFAPEPHIHFKEADVKRVDHPPSPRFLEHRHSLDHAEVLPALATLDVDVTDDLDK